MLAIFLLLFFKLSAHAQWSIEPSTKEYLDMNPLRFTNRAECALDSKRPTKSIFLLADSLNTGKALYRLGTNLNKPETFSVEGVRRFRYTLFSLAQLVSNRLLKGHLPLLKVGTHAYDEALSHCDGENNCKKMNELIGSYWTGKFRKEENKFLFSQSNSYASCLALKKFSPLEAHLYGTKPDQETLNKIGDAVHRYPEIIEVCNNSLKDEDLKVGVYQLDLINIDEKEWEAQGFYFWNSFKLYFSWAYRHSPEMAQFAGEYSNILRQVNLEESAIFFSNGCKSITAPECGKDYLNISSLRVLASSQGNGELSKLDYFEKVPRGPRDQVINPSQPEINTDILSLAEYANVSEWASNFRENISKTRGFLKLKLTKAVSFIDLIHKSTRDKLLSKLINYSQEKGCSQDPNCKQELFLLCSEYKIALDEQTSFLNKDLSKLQSDQRLKYFTNSISSNLLDNISWIINDIGEGTKNLCKQLEEKKYWNNIERPLNKSFARWYQEYVFNSAPTSGEDIVVENKEVASPYILIKNQTVKYDDKILCLTPVHCARKLLVALIDLRAFNEYASGLLTFEDSIKTPNLVNPMSERLVCRSYDPWLKTKKSISDFLQDIFMAGISTIVPSPIYVDIGILPKKVISLNELIKDGKVYYDPRFDKKRIETSLITDFGPLMSAPCAIAISDNLQEPPTNYLALSGLTLQTCRGGERNTMTVYGPEEMNNNTRNFSACFSCTINLQNTISSVQSLSPGIRPFVFLARGIVRLIQNIKDPHDIPRSWEVKPNSVYRSWRRHGAIYSSCKNKLIKGEECMSSQCEGKIISSFEEAYKKYVTNIAIYPGDMAELTVKGENHKFGVDIKRFACSLKKYKKEDFYLIEEK